MEIGNSNFVRHIYQVNKELKSYTVYKLVEVKNSKKSLLLFYFDISTNRLIIDVSKDYYPHNNHIIKSFRIDLNQQKRGVVQAPQLLSKKQATVLFRLIKDTILINYSENSLLKFNRSTNLQQTPFNNQLKTF